MVHVPLEETFVSLLVNKKEVEAIGDAVQTKLVKLQEEVLNVINKYICV